MSGLDKIVERISREAAEKAEDILSKARDQADAISRDTERRLGEECEAIARKAESEAAAIEERGRASAELRQKQLLLAGKQELLSDTISKAREQLLNLSDEEYIGVVKELFEKHISGESAKLCISAADKARFSEETILELQDLAADAGCTLTIADEPADISGGFILDYGGVEENCTFDALFDQNIEELEDEVKAILFA